MLGIFGAALLYGEGMITPAISILGAVEGLSVATPVFTQWVVPISVAILIGLFVIQQSGTDRVGKLFGPVMMVWFVTIALVGVAWIVRAPQVLEAFDPRHGIAFFREHGWHGFTVLGTVFLVVTGGEALYADMGHFGKRPIRIAWFWMVLPALLLNYFGQGALLLVNEKATQPFFMMVPSWALSAVRGVVDVSSGDCVASAHLRCVLGDAPGHPAWLHAASRCRAHLGAGDGPDLRPAGQLGTDGLHDRDHDRLRFVEPAVRRLWHGCRDGDDHHDHPAARRDDRAMEVADAARL